MHFSHKCCHFSPARACASYRTKSGATCSSQPICTRNKDGGNTNTFARIKGDNAYQNQGWCFLPWRLPTQSILLLWPRYPSLRLPRCRILRRQVCLRSPILINPTIYSTYPYQRPPYQLLLFRAVPTARTTSAPPPYTPTLPLSMPLPRLLIPRPISQYSR